MPHTLHDTHLWKLLSSGLKLMVISVDSEDPPMSGVWARQLHSFIILSPSPKAQTIA